MKDVYIKDGVISSGIIEYNGKFIINPTAEQYKAAGYELYVPPTPEPLTNDEIKEIRRQQYVANSDPLYIAWQKYLVQGEAEKAEQAKLDWLAEIDRIDKELPYNE